MIHIKANAEKATYLGEPAVQAGNEHLKIILVPGWGSNLISLVYKELNIELLRTPKSSEEFWSNPIIYGTPILFPPNRISEGTFIFNGRTYRLGINERDKNNHIHGFLYNKRWELTKAEVVGDQIVLETEFDSSKHPYIFNQFPHHFIVQMTYILVGSTLHKNATIINKSQEPFPWGFGYHTVFLFPEEICTFSLTADKRWKLNERLLPTGELEKIEYQDHLEKGVSLKDWELDDVFLSAGASRGRNEAGIYNKSNDLKIIYRADENFKHWVVYNADGKQGFVATEPYTWVTNAPNLKLPNSLTGLQVLPVGEQVTIKTEISVTSTTKIEVVGVQ